MKKICANCGIEFNADKSVQKYCSHKCADTMNSIIKRKNWSKILDFYDENCESGMTYKEMAKELGCSATQVQKVCFENGRKKPLTKRQAKIKDLYCNGSSIKDISLAINDSKKNVTHCLRILGLYETDSRVEDRSCLFCEKNFSAPKYSNKKYCSDSCQRKDGHQRNDLIRKRMKKESVVDFDITLKKLFKRDNGLCYLCGDECDWNDYKVINNKKVPIGRYPTIEHIVPIKKGGEHSWQNVKLAHFRCNCMKGVREIG